MTRLQNKTITYYVDNLFNLIYKLVYNFLRRVNHMKRNLLITLTSTIVGVLARLVMYDIYKSKVQNNLDDKTLKVLGKHGQTEELDELDKINNAEMLAEDSQIGVQIYDIYKSKVQNNLDDKTLKVSGKPGQTVDLDELDKMINAEMVAEGSQFGVQYYDKYKNV